MCHGHPRHHPCAHTSINWHYCPSALIDLETGYETPCSKMSFAAAQPTKSDCPLQNCQFKSKGGSWTCCACQQGPNTQGWCTKPLSRLTMNPESFSLETVETTCDHGCCSKCVRYGPSCDTSSPEMAFSEIRKGSASRKFGYSSATKSHRRGSALSPPVSEEDSTPSPSSSKSSSGSSRYKHDLEYTSSKVKSSKKRHRSKR